MKEEREQTDQSRGEGPPRESCGFVITDELIAEVKKMEEENFAARFPNLARWLKGGKRIST